LQRPSVHEKVDTGVYIRAGTGVYIRAGTGACPYRVDTGACPYRAGTGACPYYILGKYFRNQRVKACGFKVTIK